LNCIDVCPVADTLEVKNVIGNKTVSKKVIAFGIVLIFIAVTGIGMLTGHWRNNVTKEDYITIHKNLDAIGHPTTSSEIRELNKSTEKENR
jgi:hypothetical protein